MASEKMKAHLGYNAVVAGKVVRQTARAFLLRERATEHEVWIPKSQADYDVCNGFEILYVPAWLAKRLGVPFSWA